MANSFLSFRRDITKGRHSLPRMTAFAKAWTGAHRVHKSYQDVICASVFGSVTAADVKRTHYQVLGVQPTASPEDIRTSFRRLAKSLHPDHNKLPGAREKFQEVKEAYDILADATARADYDRELKIQAMATAAAAAQAASGGRRASTTIVRRSRPTGSSKNQAAARPASGDDFDVFTAANASPNRSSSGSDYNSIFNEPQRTTGSRGSGTTYRSVFDASSIAAASNGSPRRTASSSKSGNSSGNGPPASSSGGYQSIFASGAPRSVSAGRSGGSNPCIFNGRSISPNLGVTRQPGASAAVAAGSSSNSTGPYAPPRAAGAPNRATASPSAAGNNNVGGATGNTMGHNQDQARISTHANERSKGTASPASRPLASNNAAPKPQAGAAARATTSPSAQEPGAGSTAGVQQTASTSYVPYIVSPSIPGVSTPPSGGKAASAPGDNTLPGSRPTPESSRPVPGATVSTAVTEGATSSGASISDVAARLAAMTAAASSRSGKGGSGSYQGRIDGGASAADGTPIASGTGLPRSASPSQTAKGNVNVAGGTAVRSSSTAAGSAAVSGASFQVSVAPKVAVDNGIRVSATDPSSPNQQQQQPLELWQEHQKASPPVSKQEQPRVVPAVSVTDAEAAARVAAAMAAAAEAKAAAAAAEAMAAEAAAVAARAKAAAMAAEARLSAVVEATGSALTASPSAPLADEDLSTSGAELADPFNGAKGNEGTEYQEQLARPSVTNVVPQVKDFVRKVGAFFAP